VTDLFHNICATTKTLKRFSVVVGDDSEEQYRISNVGNYRAYLERGLAMSVMINSRELHKSVVRFWPIFESEELNFSDAEIVELEESFKEFSARNVVMIDANDRRWDTVRRQDSALDSVIPLESFEKWFLHLLASLCNMIIGEDIQRHDPTDHPEDLDVLSLGSSYSELIVSLPDASTQPLTQAMPDDDILNLESFTISQSTSDLSDWSEYSFKSEEHPSMWIANC
jgi:hypothetical protein